jgi:hypothetical protein
MKGDVVGSLNQACRIHRTARLLPRAADTSVRCINESAARRMQLNRTCDTIMRQVSKGRRMQKEGRQKWEGVVVLVSGEAAPASFDIA